MNIEAITADECAQVYRANHKNFQKHTGCPMHFGQTHGRPNTLEALHYLPDPTVLTIGSVPVIFQVENETAESVAFRVGYAKTFDARYGVIDLSFRHINATRQIGHEVLDPTKEEWYITGSWFQEVDSRKVLHRFQVANTSEGVHSCLYSLRYVHSPLPIPYSYFVQTLSPDQDSLRAVLGMTFRPREGMEFAPDAFQTDKERITGVEFRNDFGVAADFLTSSATVKLGRHNNDISEERKITLTDEDVVVKSEPKSFPDGQKPNLITRPVQCVLNTQSIRLHCDGIVNWNLQRANMDFPILSEQTDETVFNAQWNTWQKYLSLLNVNGINVAFETK
jgi:hypothetical protein